MLERYFIKPQTVDRIRASWLGEAIERYVVWLAENGYAARNVPRRVPMLMHFAEFARDRGTCTLDGAAELVGPFVDHWVATRRRRGRTKSARRHIESAARVPVEQMLALAVPGFRPLARRLDAPQPFADSAPGFFDHLHRERGLSAVTFKQYGAHLRRFEKYLERIGLQDLAELSPTVLSGFVADAGRELSKGAMSGLCSHLRIFLRYLHRERLVVHDLAGSVDSPRVYRLSTVPRAVSWEDVERLLQGVDRRTGVGKRDYAILLLLVTYGLRASEVARLTLDSIDWDSERLEIPDRKAGHHAAFPLASVVGEAIIDYLRHARPASSERALFLQVPAPFRPVGYRIVADRATRHLRNAGIEVPRPGSHTLRHSCVQRLVEAQFPLKAIGDFVGHRRPKSTEVYAKLDIETLREVALGDGEALA